MSGTEKYTIIMSEIAEMIEIAKGINQKAIKIKYRLAKAILLTKTKSSALQKDIQEIQIAYNQVNFDLQENQKQLSSLIEKSSENKKEAEETMEQLKKEHEETIADLNESIDQQKSEIDSKKAELAEKESALESADAAITDATTLAATRLAGLEELTKDYERVLAEKDEINNVVSEQDEKIKQQQEELETKAREHATNAQTISDLTGEIASAISTIAGKEGEMAAIQEETSKLQEQFTLKQSEHEEAISTISADLQTMQEERDEAVKEKEAKDEELNNIRTNIQQTLQTIVKEGEGNEMTNEILERLESNTAQPMEQIIGDLNNEITRVNNELQDLTRQRQEQAEALETLTNEKDTNQREYDNIIEQLAVLKSYLMRVVQHQNQKLGVDIPAPEGKEVAIVSQLLGQQNVNQADGSIIPSEEDFTRQQEQDENTAENLGQQFAQDSDQGRTKQAASKLAFKPQPVYINEDFKKKRDVEAVHTAIPMVLPSIYEGGKITDEQMMEIVNTLFLSEDSGDIMSGDQTALVGRYFESLPFKPRDPSVALSSKLESPAYVDLYFNRFKNKWGIRDVLPGQFDKWRDTYKNLAETIMNKVNSCMQEDETQVEPVIGQEEPLQQDAMAGGMISSMFAKATSGKRNTPRPRRLPSSLQIMKDATQQDAERAAAAAAKADANLRGRQMTGSTAFSARPTRRIDGPMPISMIASKYQNLPKPPVAPDVQVESTLINTPDPTPRAELEENVPCAKYKLRNIIYTALFASILYDEYVFTKEGVTDINYNQNTGDDNDMAKEPRTYGYLFTSITEPGKRQLGQGLVNSVSTEKFRENLKKIFAKDKTIYDAILKFRKQKIAEFKEASKPKTNIGRIDTTDSSEAKPLTENDPSKQISTMVGGLRTVKYRKKKQNKTLKNKKQNKKQKPAKRHKKNKKQNKTFGKRKKLNRSFKMN